MGRPGARRCKSRYRAGWRMRRRWGRGFFGGPALKPAPVTWTSLVGVKMSLVFRGEREMSVRLPVMVAAGEFNAETQSNAKVAKGNHGWTRINTNFGNRKKQQKFNRRK